jgi:predicted DNA-binding transcriptional regulator AlpA
MAAITMNGNGNILIGVKQVCSYLQCSTPTVYGFLNEGMPAKKYNGRWYFTKENIDRWFNGFTFVDNRGIELEEMTENDT